ncbi:MAG: S8 family serine peptidase [Candidatus Hermodarchaeota archaeon]
MRKGLICTLLLLLFLIPLIPSIPAYFGAEDSSAQHTPRIKPIDFHAMTETYGPEIPLVVEFAQPLTEIQILKLEANGVRFTFGTPSMSQVGNYYLIRGSADGLATMYESGVFDSVSFQTPMRHLHAPRDVSIPEIGADDIWATLDDLSQNVTGKGILIADLDSGIDWTHPDLWFADGGSYDWLDGVPDSIFTNGSDGVDLNFDLALQPDETLYAIDLDRDGIFDTTTEWIWADNVTQDGQIQIGEPFFVVNDTNDNGQLDPGEQLVMLKTPKTKYIVEGDGTPVSNEHVWVRGVNLTASTHVDDNGHGTAVSGILVGGQLGFRKYMGVAPDAELMMIKVLSTNYTKYDWLYVEDGLTYAYTHGADVILTEIGSWTYEFLDGSSAAATLIDTIVASGIPVISPSGNLGGSNKHARFATISNMPYYVDFDLPPTVEIYDVYITVLSINSTDFSVCNFSLIFNLQSWSGGLNNIIYLHPGVGYPGRVAQKVITITTKDLWVESFIDTSSRGTKMLGIHIWAEDLTYPPTFRIPLPMITAPPFDQLNITAPSDTTFHSYISDSATSWSGGAIWMTDATDDYHITWPSTADSALSVASYRTRNLVSPEVIGEIASFSSRGPRIDETEKQGIAAPGGFDIVTDYTNDSVWASWYNDGGSLPFDERFGSYRLFSGTSASGPHVAGTAALMLQVDSAVGSMVADIIKGTARIDAYTGAVHNPIWGYGKLNASAAVEFTSQDLVGPTIGVPEHEPQQPTDADDVNVSVTVTDLSGVDSVILAYHNGTHWNNVTMIWNGTHYVASIPALSMGTTVTYRIYSNDTLDNWSTSSDYQYIVGSSITTPTTTTSTSTTTSGPTTTPPPIPEVPNYLRIAIMLVFILLLIVFSIVLSRRRTQRLE